PCLDPESEGEKILFGTSFPIGRARFVPAEPSPVPDRPDQDYPFILNTGRQLEHWHTGVMTRRSQALDEIAPEAFVELHPADAAELGIAAGEVVHVQSRRGRIQIKAKLTETVARGTVFIPMHFR